MAGDAAAELRLLAAELRRHGGREALSELRDGLKHAAGPAADAARASILAAPAKHERDLRQGIAGTVNVTASLGATRTTVRITATGPDRWRGAASDFEDGRWRHPVFGDRERWVTQYSGAAGWFERVIAAHQDEFDRDVDRVADRIARRIAGEA